MTDQPIPQPGILDIALYQGGASTAPGARRVIKLSSNENPFGPSRKAMEALRATAETLHRYPPTDHAGLRAAIGEVHGLDPARIVCGVGSDEILSMLAYAYAGPGDEVIHTEHGFSLYPILIRSAGAVPVQVAERARVVDVDAILGAVTDRTRIVFLTNPGNPTATRIADADLTRLADGLPGRVVLVIDGAYAEFADGYDGGAALAGARANVIMTRTFSKLYGLGGLRVGWGYAAPGLIDVLNRIRPPFNLANPQLAAAEAAVRDRDWAAFCLSENARLRAWLVAELRALGLDCDASETNFVLPRFASAAAAEAAEAKLRADGILVRKVAGYGLPTALRITVGDEESCREVIRILSTEKGVAA